MPTQSPTQKSPKIRKFSRRRVKAHAKKLFQFLFPRGFGGEFFLCGGAFKPLFDAGLKLNGLDLWVRNSAARERLVGALINGGASIVDDVESHWIRLERDGVPVVVSYRDAPDAGLGGIVGEFDIAACAIGVAFRDGAIREVQIAAQANRMLRAKAVLFQDAYLDRLRSAHDPVLLCGIDRLTALAGDTGFEPDEGSLAEAWEIFESEYDADEKQRCLDTYMETVVGLRSRCDPRIVQRASDLLGRS